jgi:hypothetical protein
MAIAFVGTRGSAGTGASAGNTITQTPGATCTVGNYLYTVVTFREATTVSSISDDVGNNWEFVERYSNTTSGIAHVEVWRVLIANQLISTTVITATLAASINDRCIASGEFSVAGSTTLELSTAAIPNETNGANGFGSVATSSLSNIEHLHIRAMSKRGNTTTAITESAGFTSWGLTVRSRNSGSAIIVRVEHFISTSTGETSNPTLANVGDTANLYLAYEEQAVGGGGGTPDTWYSRTTAQGAHFQ